MAVASSIARICRQHPEVTEPDPRPVLVTMWHSEEATEVAVLGEFVDRHHLYYATVRPEHPTHMLDLP